MYFKEIELHNFRNYECCKEFFHEKVNIFTGENGNGKTNLAEALYLMCLAKSFRTSKDREMIRFKESFATVRAMLFRDDRIYKMEISLQESGKEVKINGLKRRKSELPQYVNIVVFSPEDLKIVKEDPDKRRRFMNRELSQMKPVYYETLFRYTKILSQRNTMLKEEKIDPLMLEVWNEELAAYGSKIILERKKFADELSRISGDIYESITNGKEILEIYYDPDIQMEENMEDQKKVFMRALEQSFYKDKMRGITLRGPHRDDLKLMIDGIDVRNYGSQGQQRTAALSLKLAEIEMIRKETGEMPVLILDDVLSELDQKRQDFLIHSLSEVQLFLTVTDMNEEILKKIEEYALYRVEKGKITKIEEKTGK